MSSLKEKLAARKAALVAAAGNSISSAPEVKAEVVVAPVATPAPVVKPKEFNLDFAHSEDPTVNSVRMELAELQESLNESLPNFPMLLKQIHSHLRKDPAVVTLLSEQEIHLVVSGLRRHTQVEIVAPAAVKSARKAAKGPINADML